MTAGGADPEAERTRSAHEVALRVIAPCVGHELSQAELGRRVGVRHAVSLALKRGIANDRHHAGASRGHRVRGRFGIRVRRSPWPSKWHSIGGGRAKASWTRWNAVGQMARGNATRVAVLDTADGATDPTVGHPGAQRSGLPRPLCVITVNSARDHARRYQAVVIPYGGPRYGRLLDSDDVPELRNSRHSDPCRQRDRGRE